MTERAARLGNVPRPTDAQPRARAHAAVTAEVRTRIDPGRCIG